MKTNNVGVLGGVLAALAAGAGYGKGIQPFSTGVSSSNKKQPAIVQEFLKQRAVEKRARRAAKKAREFDLQAVRATRNLINA